MVTTDLNAVSLPDLYCPFPDAIHPRAGEIEERMMCWAVERGLPLDAIHEKRIRRTRWGVLVARSFPSGAFEPTLLFAKLYVLVSEYDQIFVEEPASAGEPTRTASNLLRLLTIVNDPDCILPQDATAWERAWQVWMLDFQAVATPFQHTRFLAGMAEYCMGGACEAIYRGRQEQPPVAEYLAIRRFTAGLRLSFVTAPIEIANGYEISPTLWHRPDVMDLTKTHQTVYGYTNDILSCLRDPQMGLPTALALKYDWTLQRAIDTVARMLREETDAFIRLSDQVRARGPVPLPEYVDALQACLAGHYAWYADTGRYEISHRQPSGSCQDGDSL
ncbi:terpene synthase family protein [Nocardia terpenica]|uniref:Terpene synthase n=1 Tax=Nocardia terpenica TaxID=455432 RepID=A0A6G9ZD07_9NOCA|nr:hypothetical protein [Nocardia terpenica]QIS23495.1 hypothetical protein F6W96_39560 [Nocardia terpenica]